MARGTRPPSFADELLDEVFPEELDWERLVRTYPKTSLAVAALGGFLLARSQGPALLSAIGSLAATRLTSQVEGLLGEDGG
ncbi:MAG: hypothetical protein GX178_03815 [Acidobacteria bacterium]|jgi:hypothetical protein|nr:hypothetical protein [Thermoanaerobaculia bacterium]NLN10720.1 hypothetical protein [Acidobacteriota bacterium]OQC41743.1 MAG: hypothetical protein BWX64_00677 [Acidobacteria bacterium ADurb.Bin051]HNU82948.1 hypothetical protein [Thermoanaerobaculia bacterium]HPA96324.1 hypothetical protein [Thermoanaerobaculia bacterium]